MGMNDRGRHTLRWCPVAENLVPRWRQLPGESCPACGATLPDAYVAVDADGTEHRTGGQLIPIASALERVPQEDLTPDPPRRRIWEGPLLAIIALIAVFGALVYFTPQRPDVATVDPADLTVDMAAYERQDAGFAIALPEHWTVLDPSEGRILHTGVMDQDTLQRFQTLTAAGTEFELVGLGQDEGFGLTIITRGRARTDTVARVKYSVESALMWSFRIVDSDFELLDLDGHDALRFTYAVPGPAGELDVVQYVVLRDTQILIATFHVLSGEPADPEPFDAIMNTLRTTG